MLLAVVTFIINKAREKKESYAAHVKHAVFPAGTLPLATFVAFGRFLTNWPKCDGNKELPFPTAASVTSHMFLISHHGTWDIFSHETKLYK